jgi:NAD(P)-dependent dehydrogenase (short-subunit alcohol dehydrogenase family)
MGTFNFSGKLVLVTGSSRGLGRAMAHAFASAGATVVINGREKKDVDRAVADFKKKDLFAIAGTTDVSDSRAVQMLFDELEAHGGIDILVNNAALRPRKNFEAITEKEWDAVLDVNLKGAFLASKHAVSQMRQNGRGAIVNISSIAATVPLPYYRGAHYAAAKAGLLGLTRSLAEEVSEANIRVNAVVPGPISSDELSSDAKAFAETHSALRSPLSADAVVETVLFLASSASDGITGKCIELGEYSDEQQKT